MDYITLAFGAHRAKWLRDPCGLGGRKDTIQVATSPLPFCRPTCIQSGCVTTPNLDAPKAGTKSK